MDSSPLRGLALLSLCAVATAQAVRVDDAVRAFRREFDPAPSAKALRHLQGLDGRAVAGALIGAHQRAHAGVVATDEERMTMHATVVRGLVDAAEEIRRGTHRGNQAERNRLRVELSRLRPDLDARRAGVLALEERIAELAARDALDVLVQRVLTVERKVSLSLRLAAGRALAAQPDLAITWLGDLTRALQRRKNPEAAVGVLELLRALGTRARPAAGAALKLLGHRREMVRERAALVLGALGDGRAAAPLIELMAKESGEMRRRVTDALNVLTGAGLGPREAAWRAWLAAEGAQVLADESRLGSGTPRPRQHEPDAGSYMGIPQDGRCTIYALDASASMMNKIAPPKIYTAPAGMKVPRFDLCKYELIRALRQLPPERFFNVVFFHEVAVRFADAPVPATKDNLDAARHWVLGVKVALFTNIHDALQVSMQPPAAADRRDHPDVDTVFLLTDGRPAHRGFRGIGPAPISRAVRFWDPLCRVRIHTVAVGKGIARKFMERLSAATGGEFQLEK